MPASAAETAVSFIYNNEITSSKLHDHVSATNKEKFVV